MRFLQAPARVVRPYLSTFFSFSAIQAATLLLPLLALPRLARVVGADAFGLLMYMSVISVVVSLVMDWGFTLGAVRETAAARSQDDVLTALLGEVLSAKILLACLTVAGSFVLCPLLPYTEAHPGGCFLAVLVGIARGISPLWFFQGTGRGMLRMACWDVGSSALILCLMFLFIREPGHWPRYLLLWALCKGGAYLWLTSGLFLRYRFTVSLVSSLHILHRTAKFFVGILAALIYTNGAFLILGYFLPPQQMGLILASDKIARASVSFSYPITQTLFPELCALRKNRSEQAASLLQWSFVVTAVFMICLAGIIWLLAPFLIAAFLGHSYREAVPVLKTMIFFVPLYACNCVLGTQTLVPYGHEQKLIRVQIFAAAVSLPSAACLGYYGGLHGGSYISLIVESIIFSGLLCAVWRCFPVRFHALLWRNKQKG